MISSKQYSGARNSMGADSNILLVVESLRIAANMMLVSTTRRKVIAYAADLFEDFRYLAERPFLTIWSSSATSFLPSLLAAVRSSSLCRSSSLLIIALRATSLHLISGYFRISRCTSAGRLRVMLGMAFPANICDIAYICVGLRDCISRTGCASFSFRERSSGMIDHYFLFRGIGYKRRWGRWAKRRLTRDRQVLSAASVRPQILSGPLKCPPQRFQRIPHAECRAKSECQTDGSQALKAACWTGRSTSARPSRRPQPIPKSSAAC
jgi:hypothetical protein